MRPSLSRYDWIVSLSLLCGTGWAFDQDHIPRSLNPGYMGPNALPVPEMHETEVGHEVKTSLIAEGHLQPTQEFATNPRFSLFAPFSERTALLFQGEPVEFYGTSEPLQEERRARDRHGFAPGDLYFGAMFQITTRASYEWATSINIMTKSTTGKELESSRHTDAPGYIIDLAAGRDVTLFDWPASFSTYLAFLAWQTDIGEQNDALGQAFRLDAYPFAHHKVRTEFGYYLGTQSERDRPMVTRLGYSYTPATSSWEPFALYTYGIRDMIKHSIQLGFSYKMDVSSLISTAR